MEFSTKIDVYRSSFVSPAKKEPVPDKMDNSILGDVVALYDYAPQESGELSFSKGDRITILEEVI